MQFAVTKVVRAKPMVSVSRASVEDRLEQIVARVTGSDVKELTPQEFTYALKHIDRMPDELEPMFAAALRTRGLPAERQVNLLQLDPEWAQHLPDVAPVAQRYLLTKGRNLQELIEKIPQLTEVSPQLLRYTVNSNWATPEIILYLLVEYGKELQGMGLRKIALMHSPELLPKLPTTVELSPEEMKALLKLDPENYKFFKNPDPSVRQMYRTYLKENRADPEESAIMGLGERSLADLIDDLRDAEARGQQVLADKLRKKIAAIRAELMTHLPADGTPEGAESTSEAPDDGGPSEAHHGDTKATVDRTDLTGYVVSGGGRKMLVLQDLPVLDGEVPDFAAALIGTIEPSRLYRLLDLGSRTVYLLVPDRDWARTVNVVSKYTPGLFSQTIEQIRENDSWAPKAALGPNFKPLPVKDLGDMESESDDEGDDAGQAKGDREDVGGRKPPANPDEMPAPPQEEEELDPENDDPDAVGADPDMEYEDDSEEGDENDSHKTAVTAINNIKQMQKVLKAAQKMTQQLADMGTPAPQGGTNE